MADSMHGSCQSESRRTGSSRQGSLPAAAAKPRKTPANAGFSARMRKVNMNNPVRLTVGIVLLATSDLSAATRYVWQGSPSPAPPYTNWATAAHVIQDAVDAALAGDEIVVTNGIYATGGRAVGTTRVGQPRGGGQAADGAERQRPAVHGHPRLPGARHHQRRRRDPVRVSDQRRQPVRVHLDQRGHAE